MEFKTIDKYTQMNHFGDLIGLDLKHISEGKAVYKITISKKHLATIKAAHGGLLSAILDTVMGVACLSKLEEEKKLVATIEFKTTFFAPALINDELIATGEVIKKGKSLLFAQGKIVNQKNELIANSSGSFKSYPEEKIGV